MFEKMKMKQMKHLKLVCSFLLFFIMNFAFVSALVTVSIQPYKSYGIAGETFTKDVYIRCVSDMYGYEFKIKWDPIILTCVVTGHPINFWGSWFLEGKNETNEGYYYAIFSANGEYLQEGFPYTPDPAGHDYWYRPAATLVCTIRQQTKTTLNFEVVKLSDSNANPIFINHIFNNSYYVGGSGTIPADNNDFCSCFGKDPANDDRCKNYGLRCNCQRDTDCYWALYKYDPSNYKCEGSKVDCSTVNPGYVCNNGDNNASCTCREDINGDRKIDVKDVAKTAKAFGSFPGDPRWSPDVDINCDNTIDVRDVAPVARAYGDEC